MTSTARRSATAAGAPRDRPEEPGTGAPGAAWPPAPPRPRHAWLAPVGLAAGAAVGCVAVAAFGGTDNGPLLCPFREMTGWDCPGCGMTRGLSNLLRAHPAAALDYNALLVVATPVLAYLYLTWLAGSLGWHLPPLRFGRKSLAVLTVIALAFSVVRNVPIGLGRYLSSDPTR